MKNREFIPMSLLGLTFTILGDVVEFHFAGKVETLRLVNGEWVYTVGKKKIRVTRDDMDLILIGWFTQFDHYSNGICQIKVRSVGDAPGEYTWCMWRD